MVCLWIFYSAPYRHLLTILCFFGMTLGYTMRLTLSISILAMVPPLNTSLAMKQEVKCVDWTHSQQTLIFMGFYIGYAFCHYPSGMLTKKYGARWIIFFGMTCSCLANAAFPVLAYTHWLVAFLLRVATGIGQSVLLPGISSLLTFWIPQSVLSFTAGIVWAGVPLGTFAGIYISGIILVYMENWHWSYYTWSILTGCWLVFFLTYIYSYPQSHPALADIGSSYAKSNFIVPVDKETSLLGYTIACHTIAAFGHTYILFTLTTYLPLYINNVLLVALKDNLICASSPFVFMYFGGMCSRKTFRWLVDTRNLNEEVLRTTYCFWCTLVPAALISFGSHLEASNTTFLLVLIHFVATFSGMFYGAINMLDLNMRTVPSAAAIINGVGSTSGIFAIGVVAIVFKGNTMKDWKVVTFVLLIIVILTATADLIVTILKLRKLKQIQGNESIKWYQQINAEEHKAKMDAIRMAKSVLTERQKGAQQAS